MIDDEEKLTISDIFAAIYTDAEGRQLVDALKNFRSLGCHYRVAFDGQEITIRIRDEEFDPVHPNRSKEIFEIPLTLWSDDGPLAYSEEWTKKTFKERWELMFPEDEDMQ